GIGDGAVQPVAGGPAPFAQDASADARGGGGAAQQAAGAADLDPARQHDGERGVLRGGGGGGDGTLGAACVAWVRRGGAADDGHLRRGAAQVDRGVAPGLDVPRADAAAAGVASAGGADAAAGGGDCAAAVAPAAARGTRRGRAA